MTYSHMGRPHYHRRCVVSLLSSGRDQVVPTLYDRQAIRLDIRSLGLTFIRIQVCDFKVFAVHANFRFVDFTLQHTIIRLFGCYMVKPHGQLVLVSSTPHNAYTPSLSTS